MAMIRASFLLCSLTFTLLMLTGSSDDDGEATNVVFVLDPPKVPNGDIVPNQCDFSTFVSPGLGRNQSVACNVSAAVLLQKNRSIILSQRYHHGLPISWFDIDYMANNCTWNITLCQMDSDEDNFTNGEELGDPYCNSSLQNNFGSDAPMITHPGYCEPPDSVICKENNRWLRCGQDNGSGSSVDNGPTATTPTPTITLTPGISGTVTPTGTPSPLEQYRNRARMKSFEMRLDASSVPENGAAFMCKIFPLPINETHDIASYDPIVHNADVVHKIYVLGCTNNSFLQSVNLTNGPVDMDNDTSSDSFPCPNIHHSSCTAVASWTAAGTGQCSNAFGNPVGPGTPYEVLILRVQWKNPTGATVTDSSGMTLHLTTDIQPNLLGKFTVEQKFIQIPPRKKNFGVTGSCNSDCTAQVMQPNQSLFINSVSINMNSLGQSGQIVLIRKNVVMQYLAVEKFYDYQSPTIFHFPKPVKVELGDTLQVSCNYQSMNKTETTNYGPDGDGEVCAASVSYSPLNPNYTNNCHQYDSITVCELPPNDTPNTTNATIGTSVLTPGLAFSYPHCDFATFIAQLERLPKACGDGADCTAPDCGSVMQQVKTTRCTIYVQAVQFITLKLSSTYLDILNNCTNTAPLPPCASETGTGTSN